MSFRISLVLSERGAENTVSLAGYHVYPCLQLSHHRIAHSRQQQHRPSVVHLSSQHGNAARRIRRQDDEAAAPVVCLAEKLRSKPIEEVLDEATSSSSAESMTSSRRGRFGCSWDARGALCRAGPLVKKDIADARPQSAPPSSGRLGTARDGSGRLGTARDGSGSLGTCGIARDRSGPDGYSWCCR